MLEESERVMSYRAYSVELVSFVFVLLLGLDVCVCV